MNAADYSGTPRPGSALAHPAAVARRLDPWVHELSVMDVRVKPTHDNQVDQSDRDRLMEKDR